MKRIVFLALLSGTSATPAFAQDPHAGHVMPPPSTVGDAPPPAVIRDGAVDRFYGTAAMDRARAMLADEHGGAPTSKVMANIVEYAAVDEGSGYRWDLEAWYGGDIHRFVFKSEGEGVQGDGATRAEAQALYSRAIGRYTDVQAGVRYDFEPQGRAYATVAVESLLPYWIELEAAAFLSDRGDAFGRLEASHDLRFTQRLILQPRIELEIAAQDVPESGTGSGVSSAELGLRLRYDVRREFAPYIGVNFQKSFGETADFARAAGEDEEETSFVVGLRAWF
ncbi:MAG TPA: copper resistance protein B [Steroidobacteraceae bacterium]|nr:copper resistance protein B [Steroidobacteraceae bacterium]